MGLLPTSRVVARGGQAAVFADPKHKKMLVRIEPFFNICRAKLQTQLTEFLEVQKILGKEGLTPAVRDASIMPAGSTHSIFIMRVERVDIIDWGDWKPHFKNSSLRLTHVVFSFFLRMANAGIVHTDATPNNIVLLRDGRVIALDIFDACRYRGHTTSCDTAPRGWTVGYVDIAAVGGRQNHKSWTEYKYLYNLLFKAADIAKLKVVRQWSFKHHLQNMFHHAGMLILDVLGGKEDPLAIDETMLQNKRRFPVEVQRLIKLAIHPDREQRQLDIPTNAYIKGIKGKGIGVSVPPNALVNKHGLSSDSSSCNTKRAVANPKPRNAPKKKPATRSRINKRRSVSACVDELLKNPLPRDDSKQRLLVAEILACLHKI
jgi:hypothetical protein